MSEPIIGSIGVAVVPNAEKFWADFKAKTAAGAEEAAPTVKIHPDVTDFDKAFAEIKARAAAASATVNVKADTSNAQFQMHLLADAIIALGPATVPIAGVLSGALLGLGPAAGAAVLGITGISNELKSGALIGTQFGSTLNDLGNQFRGLQHTAADGLLSGLQKSMVTLNPLIALLNTQIGFAAHQLGSAFAAALPGLLSILKQLNPLFTIFGNLLVSGANAFTHWAQTTTGVTQFVNYVKAELPQVGHFIGQLITLIGHLVEGFAPLGSTVITGLNVLIGAINAIPIGVLQTLIPLATAGYIAFRAYTGLAVVAASVTTFTAAVRGLGVVTTEAAIAARASELVETEAAAGKTRAITVAAQAQIAASRAVIAAKDAESAAVIAATEREQAALVAQAAFFTATNEEYAAASAVVIAAKNAEAAAVTAAADKEAAATAAAALVVTATAEAEAASIQVAGEKAAIGWAGFIPIVGAAAIGIGLLTSLLGGNASASKEAAAAQQSYATSVQKSTDALNADNIAQTTTNLSKAGAFTTLDTLVGKNKTLGLTYNDLTNAVNGNDTQFKSIITTLHGVADANFRYVRSAGGSDREYNSQGAAANTLIGILEKYHGAIVSQIATQKELNTANAQAQGITDQQAASGAALYGLIGDKGVAAYLAAKTAAQSLTDQTLQQMAAFQQENDAAGILQLTLDKLSGNNLGAAQAQNAFEQQLVNMAKHTSAADASLKGLSSSAIKNRGDLNNLVQSAEASAEAYGKQQQSSEAGRQKLITLRKEIIDNAVANGENRKTVTAYVNSILTIPKSVPPTKVTVDTAQALAAKKLLQDQIDALRQGKIPPIDINTDPAMGRLGAVITRIQTLRGEAATPISLEVSAGASSIGSQSKLLPFTGGRISGPGSGTSDSIPAMVSNGEFVVNAAQTAKHLDLLHAVNRGVQGFASGGPVGDIVTLTPSKASLSAAAKKAGAVKTDSLTVTADHGAAYAIAEVIRGNIPEVKRATAELSRAVNDAFQLKGVNAKLAGVQAELKQLTTDAVNLRASVEGTLSGSVDVTKYGDVGGLLDALGNQTGANSKFTSELNKLSKQGVNPMLLQKLAAAGPNAGLDTLAGASSAQIKQVNAAFGSYITSANAGGNAAYGDVFGSRIGADQKLVASLTSQQKAIGNNIDKLVSVVAKMTGRPVEIHLDGKVIASAVFKSKEFQGVLDGLTHALVYR